MSMWISHLESSTSISAVFNDKIPSLIKVILHEVKVITGKDLIVNIRFDLSELPEPMPDKWIRRDVNSVQITIELVQAEIEKFNLGTNNYTSFNIIVNKIEDHKYIIIKDTSENDILVIKAPWIYLNAINGYKRN